ncbi:MAG: hypothetical protein U9R39_02670 [Campylobacterota bacterium]|nr:hypothetical protein [Campylobacterota bacterium]
MSYGDIFIIGWNLNALMFILNLILAIGVLKSNDPASLSKESETLRELKEEFDSYYPYRRYDTLLTYFIPFTAFFRVSFRMIEMKSFFDKNEGTRMYDFMIYKYQSDINRVKNK